MRRLLLALALGLVLFWLLASYLPQLRFWSPVAFHPRLVPWFQGLLLVGAVLFVAIQISLLWAVRRFPSRIPWVEVSAGSQQEPRGVSPLARAEVRIDRRLEYLWTALPLVGTLVLIGVTAHLIGG